MDKFGDMERYVNFFDMSVFNLVLLLIYGIGFGIKLCW